MSLQSADASKAGRGEGETGATEKAATTMTIASSPECTGRACGARTAAALASHLRRLSRRALAAAEVRPHRVYARGRLRLDGPTLENLELLAGADGGAAGSLLSRIDSCCSPGGRRLMRRWLTAPLRDPNEITERQDAVEALGGAGSGGSGDGDNGCGGEELAGRLRVALRRAPDLERAVGRARAAASALTANVSSLPPPLAQARHTRRVAALAAAAPRP